MSGTKKAEHMQYYAFAGTPYIYCKLEIQVLKTFSEIKTNACHDVNK